MGNKDARTFADDAREVCCRFYVSELQNNSVQIWWSSGVYDTLFPPSLVTEYAAVFSAVSLNEQTPHAQRASDRSACA